MLIGGARLMIGRSRLSIGSSLKSIEGACKSIGRDRIVDRFAWILIVTEFSPFSGENTAIFGELN
jgi:hypothetical protein